jgi:hypothetical protein
VIGCTFGDSIAPLSFTEWKLCAQITLIQNTIRCFISRSSRWFQSQEETKNIASCLRLSSYAVSQGLYLYVHLLSEDDPSANAVAAGHENMIQSRRINLQMYFRPTGDPYVSIVLFPPDLPLGNKVRRVGNA